MIVPAVLGGTAAVAGIAAHGAFYRNSFVFGRALGRLPTQQSVVALTFDDGPNPDATPRILDALGDAGIRATFFILGRHAERWPGLVRRVHDEGHALGNHGYFHRKLQFRSPHYVRADLARGSDAIAAACGVRPTLFRAPHGFRSPW
ncbi:MAG: polysaccharide deacetylase family protein, partial [Gemmatimonadaceae bacterium]